VQEDHVQVDHVQEAHVEEAHLQVDHVQKDHVQENHPYPTIQLTVFNCSYASKTANTAQLDIITLFTLNHIIQALFRLNFIAENRI
jgi:hypothetical protein